MLDELLQTLQCVLIFDDPLLRNQRKWFLKLETGFARGLDKRLRPIYAGLFGLRLCLGRVRMCCHCVAVIFILTHREWEVI